MASEQTSGTEGASYEQLREVASDVRFHPLIRAGIDQAMPEIERLRAAIAAAIGEIERGKPLSAFNFLLNAQEGLS